MNNSKPPSNSAVVIIGSGLAGYTLAREIRKYNTDIPLHIVTADDGSYYSKPQLSSALGHKKTAAQLATMDATKAATQFNATIHTHSVVTDIDVQLQQIIFGNTTLPYQHLIFACGALPVQPVLTGDAVDRVHSINDLQDYRQFRVDLTDKKHVAIIGSGLVGCEFCNDLLNAEYQVTVVCSTKTPLGRILPPALGKTFQAGMAAKGISWLMEHRAVAVNHTANNKYQLSFLGGDTLEADLIIRAIGLRPNIALANSAGIKTNNGIVVDRYLRTNIPNIYALGDCAEVEGQVLLYIAPLVLSARALAKSICGELTAVQYPPMPIYVKTPAFPVIVALPPTGLTVGEWKITTDTTHGTGLLYNENQQLRGFALVGTATAQSTTLVKELPPLLA